MVLSVSDSQASYSELMASQPHRPNDEHTRYDFRQSIDVTFTCIVSNEANIADAKVYSNNEPTTHNIHLSHKLLTCT
jgi:hypothetical protein